MSLAHVGAPWVLTQAEVSAKLDQTNTAFLSFDDDLQSRLVTVDVADPTQALTDAIAATDANSGESINLRTWYLARFGAQSQKSLQNRVGKSPSTLASELAFYSAWLKVLIRWRLFFLRHQSLLFTLYYADIWDTCDRFNAELLQWQQKAGTDYGVHTTAPSPPTEPGTSFPWKWVIGGVAVAVAVTQGPTILALFRGKRALTGS